MVRYLSGRVAIMYLGRIVELASRVEIFARPKHPYTELLLTSSSNPDPSARRLHLVKAGDSPSYGVRPSGCPFHTRCPYREPRPIRAGSRTWCRATCTSSSRCARAPTDRDSTLHRGFCIYNRPLNHHHHHQSQTEV